MMMALEHIYFSPALIIEATMVCDHACPGCYAPNWVSKDIPQDALRSHPELFLSPVALETALQNLALLGSDNHSASIGGGEPTRHPQLYSLITILHRHARTIFLETHGGWIGRNQLVLNACRDLGITVVISFDSMHDLSAGTLRDWCAYLERESVAWLIKITEESSERYSASRSSCNWISGEQILYQQKVRTSGKLFKPSLGVIRVDGTITRTLTSRDGIFVP
jgi:hypothetical protein